MNAAEHATSAIEVFAVIESLGAGGAERQMVLLLRHLDRTRFAPSLCVFLPDGALLSEVAPDIPVVILGKRSATDAPRLVARLAGLLRQRRPGVVLAKLEYTNIITALANRLSGTATPLLLGQEAIQSVAEVGATHARVRRAGLRWAYKHAVVTAPSSGVISDLTSKLAIDAASFAVIPNMVDLDAVERAAGQPADHAFRGSRLPLLVTAGRLALGKGQDDLLMALESLNRIRPTNLLMLATGPELERLVRLAADLGVADRVSFAGYVRNPWALMRQADVFVSPSHAESFGNVIIEAMAANVPVVSTRVPYGPETIIIDGQNGLFARPRNPDDLAAKIEMLLADPAGARAMAARARKYVGRYDAPVVVAQYEDLLARIGAPRGPGSR